MLKRLKACALAASLLVTATTVHAQMSALHTSGTNIVNASGTTVQLKGTNLGGWFIMENYMTPIDSGGTYATDQYTMMMELSNRFGVTTERSLINTYQTNFITTADLDNIQNAGLNVVRIPIWWGMFFSLSSPSQSTYRTDGFTVLDNIINACASRGIYVILSMHGAVGSQSGSEDTGQASAGGSSTGQYFSSSTDQALTAWLWGQIATHYSSSNFGNAATIAGFDLLNEPVGGTQAQVVAQYNTLYTAVRNADANRMLFLETIDSASWSMADFVSPSSQSWSNVVYSTHVYACSSTPTTCTASQVTTAINNAITHYNSIKTSFNVPGYIGEYTAYNTGYSEWQSVQTAMANAGLSRTAWAYKANTTPTYCLWGWYCPTSTRPTTPNIGSDSSATISTDWSGWTTSPDFAQNSTIHM
ncbi:glycoside hydrolase family 5 protein [Granulicella cerasi]|uniref:Glycoside hydrolase family 5 protein n=1 Tax=Granulicella cerasi TaxID=741063 RepID=A0ABW1ZGB5_9BACT|nr:glycoside hydrolase family 5 protein [Granulicella cerasi]